MGAWITADSVTDVDVNLPSIVDGTIVEERVKYGV
jgi:hypothetical protein